jgi:hypothetical protein
MAIPSRQIGWGTEENLLWQISKQLEYLTRVVYNIPNNTTSTSTSTTTTTTTAVPTYSYFSNYSNVSQGSACYQAQDQFTIYTPVSIDTGVLVYTDEALTTLATTGFYSFSGVVYDVLDGLITGSSNCPASNAYNYVISQTDLDAAVGNTDTALNGKVFTLTADDGSGNPASRTFTASGSYIHWMCSISNIIPTFGYYAADVFITDALVSTQTNSGPC